MELIEKVEKVPSFADLLKRHVLDTIVPYESTLEEQTEEEEKLGKPAREKLEQHKRELGALRDLLSRLISGEEFQPVVSLRKSLPDALGVLSKEPTHSGSLREKRD